MNRRMMLGTAAAVAVAALAVPASASVTGAVSEYWGTCPDLAASTSVNNPYSVSPGPADFAWPRQVATDSAWTGAGPSLSNVHADATTTTLASYERAAHNSGDTTWCQLHSHITNVLTVGAGRSGLAAGAPVTVVLNTTFGGSLGGWGETDAAFGTGASASVNFSVKDGYTSLATYTADGYANIDGYAGNATEYATDKYDLYLYGNNSGSYRETPNEQQTTVPGAVAGSYVAPPVVDFGTSVGARTIRFDTYVGARLTLDGAVRTDEQSFGAYSAGIVDLEPGFHASFTADPADTGIALTLATDTSTVPTTTAVTSFHAVYGQPVPLFAAVSSGSGVPSGTVAFSVDGAPVGAGALDGSGVVTLPYNTTTPYLGVGVHTITASYSGGVGYDASVAGATLTVAQAATTTGLSVYPVPASPNQRATLTASVLTVGPGAGVPTGTVVFRDGSTLLGTAGVDAAGKATLVVGGKQLVGYHVLSATYGGDINHGASIGQRTIPNSK